MKNINANQRVESIKLLPPIIEYSKYVDNDTIEMDTEKNFIMLNECDFREDLIVSTS